MPGHRWYSVETAPIETEVVVDRGTAIVRAIKSREGRWYTPSGFRMRPAPLRWAHVLSNPVPIKPAQRRVDASGRIHPFDQVDFQ